jgi:hypothetical protein
MRLFKSIISLFLLLSLQSFAQTKEEQDAGYTKTITQRAEKIVTPLGISNPETAAKVRDIIVQQYRSLNDIHTLKDNRLKSAKELSASNKKLAEELSENAENEANACLYKLHFEYLSKLRLYLDENQVELVKDGMTYGVLPITYKGYCNMVLGLTEEQKRQIKIWLTEAREHAMDAGTSDEKHEWFGKYKGRINNYLSAAGYDMKKEGEEWQKRISSGKTAQAPAPKDKPLPPVYSGADGHMGYTPDNLGNRVPDFSYCGYKASEQPIPNVMVQVVVPSLEGNATLRIQSALDYVASLPADKDGFRGAVLLGKGYHSVEGDLTISASGVVLRGCGTGPEGTVLLAAGTDRRTLIRVSGKNDKELSAEIKITDKYVPVNAVTFHVAEAGGLHAGDFIRIHRPSTAEWIDTLKCNHFGGGITALSWKPGTRDIFWDQKITAMDGSRITVDVPLTTALDETFGGGMVASYSWPGVISQIGIENMVIRSAYDTANLKDEAHSWMAVTIENSYDAWVRQVTFEHFAGSAVAVYETARRITVEDCKSLSPVSEIGGQRRNSFFTSGQQTLFQRCYAEYGYHDFAVGTCAAGPNAFVQCESKLSSDFSGTIGSWASGVLFDIVNVDGNALSFKNRGQDGQGAGWSAANSVFWQCTAARVDNFCPPTANNWAFGTWAQFSGDGYWNESNNQIRPRSLYYAQLAERSGRNVNVQSRLFPMETEASTSPSVETAAMLTVKAREPLMLLTEWIDLAAKSNPIPIEAAGAKTIDQIGIKNIQSPGKAPVMQIQNGWLVRGKSVLTGKKHSVPWWNVNPIPAVTRFVPGRRGNTATDDLNELTGWMQKEHIVSLEQNYGLWYERRRDDHERIRRMDGDVWPPFYELPFARSGQGIAWDGLSKYDLTKYNTWYWSRLKQFADLADQKGLVLVHQNYFQHNIIEAGAHWADFPWRPVNNINNTGFPEPVPYAGDKRIFMAEQFYDVSHPVRRPLHEAFIRKCMENFSDNNGVIQYISEEFTGPFHFVRFWLETIRKWESETGKKAIIGLAVTKDVQDSVLANPQLASVVDMVDIRYWFYREDGSAYAPLGGQNLAPRQHARLVKPGNTSFDQVYRAIREVHNRFPEKAVTYSADKYDSFGWAVFMAGGSLPVLPVIQATDFLESASGMSVVKESGKGQYKLRNDSGESIIYLKKGIRTELDIKKLKGNFLVVKINPVDGSVVEKQEVIKVGKVIPIENPSGDMVLWLTKK